MSPTSCRRCGEILNAHANFCWSCGAAQHDATSPETQSIPLVVRDDAGQPVASPTVNDCDLLTIAIGHDGFEIFELRDDVVTVGRHEDAAIVLDDISVSRRHAVFQRTASGRITVRDLNSLNGTYVNGTRVEETAVRTGDEIQIGKYKIVFWGCES